ncbi:hypothetical protein PanWU01x14_194410 [Parasponia andersonii]|uniref:Uncharacterized protein n=1 Tax=Parasponia andersonii TaxID=3476 RepID=A0A2P5C0I1_PARAD|nr:hypothetical protein PanWU01x14_194410 [Parasponia andersonii]
MQKASEKRKEKEREAEIERKEKEMREKYKSKTMSEGKREKESNTVLLSVREEKYNFIAKKSEIKRALILQQPLIVLMYKEPLLCIDDLTDSLPSNIVSLFRSLKMYFSKRPSWFTSNSWD